MPMDSSQIAALTGGFNQQVMMGMQHSAMISQMYGGYAPGYPGMQPVPTPGQQFAGMGMQAMGQMGMSALGSQRLNNFGGGVMQPFTQSGQFMMGQMMYGAQQQQMLDANLQQSYRHMNAFGGRGFTQTETAGIGQDLRSLAMMRGPGGQQTSFEELGRLASNMGRMGMAEGVRSAKDFNEKFKEMLTTVKTVAEELGSSLEEAQKVMASMKGSGIFRGQGQMAALIRKGAVGGNLATSELSSAALIGSQISRSVGGLGSSGAYAGVNAMANIGAARQAGVLSEEDIYNVTGLTGAEGRRSMMQRNLAGDAQFFSSGLGRRALAAIAGKNGKLDEEDVQAFMSGGVGTGETMQRAYQNLGQVGRANFIRNEGRLRGEAMRAFGGMGKAIVARNWLEERGMDMNEMDDRSMLFFQRRFNVGRDEADQLIKMARNMDRIQQQQRSAGDNDKYAQLLERQQRMESPMEILKRAEMARTGLTNQMRQTGADLYSNLSVGIGEMLGRASGDYIDRRRGDLGADIATTYRGGPGAEAVNRRVFGRLGLSAADRALSDSMYGGESGLTGAQFNRFLGGQASELRAQGFDVGSIRNAGDYQALQMRAHRQRLGFAGGGSGLVGTSVDEGTQSALKEALLSSQGKGDKFLDNLEKKLVKVQTEQGKEIYKAFKEANNEQRAALVGDLAKLAKVDVSSRAAGAVRDMPITSGGRFATREGELTAVGRGLTAGLGDSSSIFNQDLLGGFQEGAGDLALMLGGGETKAGRLVSSITGKDSLLGGGVAKLDALRRDLVNNREGYAATVAGAPRSAAKGLLGMGGRGLVSLGIAKEGFAEDWFGKGGLSGQGGLIDRLAKASGYEENVEGALAGTVRGALGGVGDRQARQVAEYLRGKEGQGIMSDLFLSTDKQRTATLDKLRTRQAELSGMSNLTSTEQTEMQGIQAARAAAKYQELSRKKGATREDWASAAEDIYGKGTSVEQFMERGGTALRDFSHEQDAKRRQQLQGMASMAREDIELAARRAPDADTLAKLRKEGKLTGAGDRFMSLIQKRREALALGTEAGAATAEGLSGQLREGMLSGSIADREKLASELGTRGEYDAQGMLRRQLSVEKRLQRAGARGGDSEARTIAGMLGANFAKGELGGTSEEQLAKISGQLGLRGVEGGEEAMETLRSVLGDKSLSRAQRAEKIQTLQGSRALEVAQRNQQDEQAKQSDPSYRALNDIKKSSADMAKNTEGLKGAINQLGTDIKSAMGVGEGESG